MQPDITIHLAESTGNLLQSEAFIKDNMGKLVYRYPENGKNAAQLQHFISYIEEHNTPVAIVTDSLYLLREFHLTKVPVTWKNWDAAGKEYKTSANVNDIGEIHILDRELEQSGRYLDQENGVSM